MDLNHIFKHGRFLNLGSGIIFVILREILWHTWQQCSPHVI